MILGQLHYLIDFSKICSGVEGAVTTENSLKFTSGELRELVLAERW
jgi:hypothetical protein